MLNEPHLKRIKVMKTRLNKADKENEKKLHYNLLQLITRYEEECLPENKRRRFTEKTSENVLRFEYHGMFMQSLSEDIIRGRIDSE